MTPTAATPPTPIRADVEVVAPAAKGLHNEEDKKTIFLDRERIASAVGCLFSSANVPRGRGSGGSCGS